MDMDCKRIEDLLSPYIDNELAADERSAVDAHLRACDACRADYERLRQTVALLNSLEDIEVPADVSSALQTIPGRRTDRTASRAAGKRGWLETPRLTYLLASGAVAAVALISVISLTSPGLLGNKPADIQALRATEETAQQAPVETYGSAQQDADTQRDATAKSGALSGAGTPQASTPKEKNPEKYAAAPKGDGASDELLARGLPDDATNGAASATDGTKNKATNKWPVVFASKTNYAPASVEALLKDIHNKTKGLYRVGDVRIQKDTLTSTMIAKATSQGAQGELLKGPINALLNQTKRPALPVYLEKAKFQKKDCLLIAIKWGFGADESELYRTSIYVTDLSGWNNLHYATK